MQVQRFKVGGNRRMGGMLNIGFYLTWQAVQSIVHEWVEWVGCAGVGFLDDGVCSLHRAWLMLPAPRHAGSK